MAGFAGLKAPLLLWRPAAAAWPGPFAEAS